MWEPTLLRVRSSRTRAAFLVCGLLWVAPTWASRHCGALSAQDRWFEIKQGLFEGGGPGYAEVDSSSYFGPEDGRAVISALSGDPSWAKRLADPSDGTYILALGESEFPQLVELFRARGVPHAPLQRYLEESVSAFRRNAPPTPVGSRHWAQLELRLENINPKVGSAPLLERGHTDGVWVRQILVLEGPGTVFQEGLGLLDAGGFREFDPSVPLRSTRSLHTLFFFGYVLPHGVPAAGRALLHERPVSDQPRALLVLSHRIYPTQTH